jgi:hypothetical protein
MKAKFQITVDGKKSVTAVFAATLDSSIPVESGETVTFVNDVSIDLSSITLPPDTTVTVQDVKDEVEDELP